MCEDLLLSLQDIKVGLRTPPTEKNKYLKAKAWEEFYDAEDSGMGGMIESAGVSGPKKSGTSSALIQLTLERMSAAHGAQFKGTSFSLKSFAVPTIGGPSFSAGSMAALMASGGSNKSFMFAQGMAQAQNPSFARNSSTSILADNPGFNRISSSSITAASPSFARNSTSMVAANPSFNMFARGSSSNVNIGAGNDHMISPRTRKALAALQGQPDEEMVLDDKDRPGTAGRLSKKGFRVFVPMPGTEAIDALVSAPANFSVPLLKVVQFLRQAGLVSNTRHHSPLS